MGNTLLFTSLPCPSPRAFVCPFVILFSQPLPVRVICSRSLQIGPQVLTIHINGITQSGWLALFTQLNYSENHSQCWSIAVCIYIFLQAVFYCRAFQGCLTLFRWWPFGLFLVGTLIINKVAINSLSKSLHKYTLDVLFEKYLRWNGWILGETHFCVCVFLKYCQLISQSVYTISTWPALGSMSTSVLLPILGIPSLQLYLLWDKVRSMWLYSSSPEDCDPAGAALHESVCHQIFVSSFVTFLFRSDFQCTLKGFWFLIIKSVLSVFV